MMILFTPCRALVTLGFLLFFSCSVAAQEDAVEYPWQEPQATVTETGSVHWKPKPFVDDLSGQDVRYIDFENGDDSNDGKSPETAWQHHPWDWAQAADSVKQAAEDAGPLTYVFKRGVIYRGFLDAKQSGTAEKPIRLVSTASWGEGEPLLVGSEKLPPQWVRVDQADDIQPPERLPDHEKVWVLALNDLEFWEDENVRRIFERPTFVGLFTHNPDGSGTRNHLARDPNWESSAGSEIPVRTGIARSSSADGEYFQGALDFMRVAHGTLEDAKTTIDELYAWQYVSGPHLFDMRGQKPKGKRRDVGALELR